MHGGWMEKTRKVFEGCDQYVDEGKEGNTHSATVPLGIEAGGTTWWSSMLLHTTFWLLAPPFCFSPSGLQSDDGGTELLLLHKPSSRTANVRNTSTLIFLLLLFSSRTSTNLQQHWARKRNISIAVLSLRNPDLPSLQRRTTMARTLFVSCRPSSSISLRAFPSLHGGQRCPPLFAKRLWFPSHPGVVSDPFQLHNVLLHVDLSNLSRGWGEVSFVAHGDQFPRSTIVFPQYSQVLSTPTSPMQTPNFDLPQQWEANNRSEETFFPVSSLPQDRKLLT